MSSTSCGPDEHGNSPGSAPAALHLELNTASELRKQDLCEVCGAKPGTPRPAALPVVLCGLCWAQHGGFPAASEIGAAPAHALPVREPRNQAEWIRALAAEEWVKQLRGRTRERLLVMARELMLHANWTTFESWPTWDRLMEVSRWARSTMAGWLRYLRLKGWLVLVETGSTPQYRPMGSPEQGNRAAVYGLRIPLGPTANVQVSKGEAENWTPTQAFDLLLKDLEVVLSRARELFHNSQGQSSVITEISEALRASLDEKQGCRFADQVPVTKFEMLVAAAELRAADPALARLSRKNLRQLCHPYWRAQWTNNDVLHALRWAPNSWTPRHTLPAHKLIVPARWVETRLAAWRTDCGKVLPGRSAHDQAIAKIRKQHGHAAPLAMPAGEHRLTAENILTRARQLSGEAKALVTAAIARRSTTPAVPDKRPAQQPAAQRGADGRTDVQRRMIEQARAAIAARKQVTTPPPASADPADDTSPARRWWKPTAPAIPDGPMTAEERRQLALDRARYERSQRRY